MTFILHVFPHSESLRAWMLNATKGSGYEHNHSTKWIDGDTVHWARKVSEPDDVKDLLCYRPDTLIFHGANELAVEVCQATLKKDWLLIT